MVLPDGPATRGAATSWRVYLVSLSEGAFCPPVDRDHDHPGIDWTIDLGRRLLRAPFLF
jgi:hypothetical protein